MCACLCSLIALAGCASQSSSGSAAGSSAQSGASGSPEGLERPVRVASLKGPTSIGLVALMQQNAEATDPQYEFTIAGTADEIVPNFIQGNVDIALVPANVASVLYNRTDGDVVALDINTLGVLSVVTADQTIRSFDDLAGHTVIMTGKGTTPEYAMRYLLEQAGIADLVTLVFRSEATEVAALLKQDPQAIAVLPQPYATAVSVRDSNISSVVQLSAVWDSYAPAGSRMVTGVTIASRSFVEQYPNVVTEFLARQAASVASVNEDPEEAAQLVADFGIVDSKEVAQRAIPACSLVCIQGADMKAALGAYLEVLAGFDEAAIGGMLPGDDFYYQGND